MVDQSLTSRVPFGDVACSAQPSSFLYVVFVAVITRENTVTDFVDLSHLFCGQDILNYNVALQIKKISLLLSSSSLLRLPSRHQLSET